MEAPKLPGGIIAPGCRQFVLLESRQLLPNQVAGFYPPGGIPVNRRFLVSDGFFEKRNVAVSRRSVAAIEAASAAL
jgi:hypothetical protein